MYPVPLLSCLSCMLQNYWIILISRFFVSLNGATNSTNIVQSRLEIKAVLFDSSDLNCILMGVTIHRVLHLKENCQVFNFLNIYTYFTVFEVLNDGFAKFSIFLLSLKFFYFWHFFTRLLNFAIIGLTRKGSYTKLYPECIEFKENYKQKKMTNLELCIEKKFEFF